MPFSLRKIVVTGGCGFLGSNFVNYLAHNQPDVEVTVLDSLTYAGNLANIKGLGRTGIEFIHGNVCDVHLLDEVVKGKDAVVHFAAETHIDNSILNPSPFIQSNIVGTFCVLEACRRHDVYLHHISTDEVFGDLGINSGTEVGGNCEHLDENCANPSLSSSADDSLSCDAAVSVNNEGAFVGSTLSSGLVGGRSLNRNDKAYSDSYFKFTELSPYRPSSPYSASKASSDMLVRAWIRTYGLKATISNSSNCYGPLQHVEKFIPKQITRLLSGLKPVLYGDGLNVRDWMFADDHSSAVWSILTKGRPGESYLISSNCEKANLIVVQTILQQMGYPLDFFERVDDRPGHDRRYARDSSKLRHDTGWKPVYGNFEEGIKETIEWYKNNFSQ